MAWRSWAGVWTRQHRHRLLRPATNWSMWPGSISASTPLASQLFLSFARPRRRCVPSLRSSARPCSRSCPLPEESSRPLGTESHLAEYLRCSSHRIGRSRWSFANDKPAGSLPFSVASVRSGASIARPRIRLTQALSTPCWAAMSSIPGTSPISIIRCHRCARARATTSGRFGWAFGSPSAAAGRPEGPLGRMISFRPPRRLNSVGTRMSTVAALRSGASLRSTSRPSVHASSARFRRSGRRGVSFLQLFSHVGPCHLAEDLGVEEAARDPGYLLRGAGRVRPSPHERTAQALFSAASGAPSGGARPSRSRSRKVKS